MDEAIAILDQMPLRRGFKYAIAVHDGMAYFVRVPDYCNFLRVHKLKPMPSFCDLIDKPQPESLDVTTLQGTAFRLQSGAALRVFGDMSTPSSVVALRVLLLVLRDDNQNTIGESAMYALRTRKTVVLGRVETWFDAIARVDADGRLDLAMWMVGRARAALGWSPPGGG